MLRIRRIIASILLGFLAINAFADGFDGYPSLRESYDHELQAKLENILKIQGLSNAVAKNKLCVSLVDITDLNDPRVAAVNGDHMMYAASLPKIAILLGAFAEAERGNLALDAATRDSLTQMIRVSSNVEATRMLNKVGKQRLIDILESEQYRLYDPLVNGGLWVGKEYGKSPAYQRDPLHNLSHGATVMQVARFYYMLETGQLVNSELTQQMKEMLSKPGIEHKFVKGLAGKADTEIFRKSGSWSKWHADSAIVESGKHRYIVVALAENSKGGKWLTNLIGPLHDLVVPSVVARR